MPQATIRHSYFLLLHSEIPSWRMLKLAKWDDDDAISRDTLRMDTTNLTNANLTFSQR
jgi:hypothetical protein